jgi:hypothetical protein
MPMQDQPSALHTKLSSPWLGGDEKEGKVLTHANFLAFISLNFLVVGDMMVSEGET